MIYFHSDRGGPMQIWRIPAEGGEALQVTRTPGGQQSQESPDGRDLYFLQGPQALWDLWRLMRIATDGGEEAEVLPAPVRSFDLGRNGVYYMTVQGAGRSREYRFLYRGFASGEVEELLRRETSAPLWSLTVSPAEDWIAWQERPPLQSEIVLVENFR